MPLISNQKAWKQWKKEHTGKKYAGDKLPTPYVSGDVPEKFPCWLTPYYYSGDYQSHWTCSFTYKDEDGQWDLQTYEDNEGWG